MLTAYQRAYIERLSRDIPVTVRRHDENILEVARATTSRIKDALPELEIYHVGTTALGIAGRGDVNLNLFGISEDMWYYRSTLSFLFGEPWLVDHDSARWYALQDGVPVSAHLAERLSLPALDEMKMHHKLESDSVLRTRYEQFIIAGNALCEQKYQERKCAWFNEQLNIR